MSAQPINSPNSGQARWFAGLSTDTKPAPPAVDESREAYFLELDTRNSFVWHVNQWRSFNILGGGSSIIEDVIALTPVLDTVAYAAGDVLFVPTEITGFAATSGGVVTIVSVAADDKSDQGMPFDLLFLDSNTSIGAINTAVNLSGANAPAVRATVSSGTWLDLGGARHSTFFISPVKVKVAAGQTSIWVAGIARGAGTFSASGLVLYIGVEKA